MSAKLQFWFDFASTYSYLSAMRIEQAASAKGVVVEWQPFLLGPIFAEQGWNTSPFNLYPAKGRYMWRDMERLCTARKLPLKQPEPFPQNSLKAARLALAVEQGHQRAAFTREVYSAQFGAGQNISDPSALADCLVAADVSPESLERTGDPQIKTALFDQVDQAKALHIFGAPSFIAGGELFWGDDRLDDAISHASAI